MTKQEAIDELRGHFACYGGQLVAFGAMARDMFVKQVKEKAPFTRKPSIALRLHGSDPAYRLCVSPYFNHYSKQVVPHRLNLELIHEVPVGELFKATKRLTIELIDGQPSSRRWFRDSCIDDAQRVTEIVNAFVRDPADVLRNCLGRCAICGRKLSDGTSRARGVGPECVELWDMFFITKSLFSITEG